MCKVSFHQHYYEIVFILRLESKRNFAETGFDKPLLKVKAYVFLFIFNSRSPTIFFLSDFCCNAERVFQYVITSSNRYKNSCFFNNVVPHLELLESFFLRAEYSKLVAVQAAYILTNINTILLYLNSCPISAQNKDKKTDVIILKNKIQLLQHALWPAGKSELQKRYCLP